MRGDQNAGIQIKYQLRSLFRAAITVLLRGFPDTLIVERNSSRLGNDIVAFLRRGFTLKAFA